MAWRGEGRRFVGDRVAKTWEWFETRTVGDDNIVGFEDILPLGGGANTDGARHFESEVCGCDGSWKMTGMTMRVDESCDKDNSVLEASILGIT